MDGETEAGRQKLGDEASPPNLQNTELGLAARTQALPFFLPLRLP